MKRDIFSLKGKTFLITGGSRGIGKAVSLQFARAGAKIIANYVRDIKAAEKMLAETQKENLSMILLRADLTGAKGLEKIKQAIDELKEPLSGFIHCAATGVHKPLSELTSRHFDLIFALNVRAFFELVNLLLPNFTEGASIVAVSSAGARRAVPSYAFIGSSKAALESLARHMAAELAPKNIRVNILLPGSVLTDAWKAMPDSERRIKNTISRTPLKRLVTAEDVAKAALFLCSDASSGVVGQTLIVDGGASITE